jgi:serine/threonine-protein phosphatase 4 regulatory subunit 1
VADSVEKIVPVIERLVRDAEPSVRGQLVESLPHFCAFLKDNLNLDGYTTNVLHILLPLVAELTTDDNPQTRAAAVSALVLLAKTIRHEDLVPYLIPIIRSLAKDRTEEEHRVQAAILLHSLAEVLGRVVCVEHVVPRVEQLSKDTQFRVRKAVAQHLGQLVSVVCSPSAQIVSSAAVAEAGKEEEQARPAESEQVLLSVFVELSRDAIWGVRKACCDSLVAVSAACASDVRSTVLVPLFERLADDESRWVRGSAFQNLGPFIATFSDGRVDPKLLMFYRTMPHPSKHGRDGDIALYCAHAFPGVLLTVGGARWGELSDLYLLLVKDLQWKVRETLAHSLHEVARIVGQQVAERTLLTIFEAFVSDLDEIKMGVVSHVAAFLAVLSPECRAQYAGVVRELSEEGNWRVRETVAGQMSEFAVLFVGKELSDVIVPSGLSLLRDKVQSVRCAAVDGAARLLAVAEAQADTALFRVLEGQLRQLLTGPYQDRRAVAQVCGAYLALPSSKRGAWSLEMLETLATDKTPNVRMAVAAVLAKYRGAPDSPGWLALKNDSDFDVRYCATGEWVPPAQRKPKQKGEITANMTSLAAATPERRRIDSKEMHQFADSASLIPQLRNQEL